MHKIRAQPIPGFAGYIATELGHIMSLHSQGKRFAETRMQHATRINPWLDKYGRAYVKLRSDMGFRCNVSVACAVLTAFVGPCPPQMECCHTDDDNTNNRLDNLRWDTRSNNQIDRLKNCRSGTAKIDIKTAARIKRLHLEGYRQCEIRDMLGVPGQIVSQTIYGKSWVFVEPEVLNA